jgi:predicted membrane-bound spermidine synthase
MKCRECGGNMKEGIALQNIWTSGGRKGARVKPYDCIGPSWADWVMVTCRQVRGLWALRLTPWATDTGCLTTDREHDKSSYNPSRERNKMDLQDFITHPAMMLLWIYGIVLVWANLHVRGIV